jgi:hypothetical protein
MAQRGMFVMALFAASLTGLQAQDAFGPATDRVGLPKYADYS